MSRSGYDDDYDQWDLIRWRGAVTSAIRGKRGQAFLREMLEALDALPEKALIENEVVTFDGQVCAMGAVAQKRGLDFTAVDPEESDVVANKFGVSEALVREIAYENDDGFYGPGTETPEQRWQRMRRWVVRNLKNYEDAQIIG